MSYFDDASLVMIPSGYKNAKVYSVKPTDGTGDLTFSRASSATRVQSDGLIEKVRTNLLTYSNTFSDAAWSKNNLTLTSGQTDPNGGSTAFLIQSTGVSAPTFGQTNASAARTTSIFAKAGTRTNFSILNGGYNNGAEFNLSTQSATAFGVGSLAKIESVGSGWFRCSVALSSSTETQFILTDIAGNGGVIGDNLTFAFAQSETGDIATDYIPTTSAAVSVGPVSGLPRLDYLNSTCPRLLLEPQRTNNLVYSEQFTNAAWATDGNGAGETKTANYAISPDGYQDADRIQLNRTGGSYSRVRQDYVAAGTHTGSVYLKSNTGSSQKIWMRVDGTVSTKITITTSWQRFVVSGSTSAALELFIDNTDAEIATIADFSAWGAQLEAGAYATSYIPTLGTSVTRVADAASKTGISSLIGQTEGTLFAEFVVDSSSSPTMAFFVSAAGVFDNAIWIQQSASDSVIFRVFSGSSAQASITKTGLTNGQTVKVAGAYKANDFVLYVNGVQVGTDTSGSIPASLSQIEIGSYAEVGSPFNQNRPIKQAILFPTRLSNSDLAALTA
jgi:hypothetical protein